MDIPRPFSAPVSTSIPLRQRNEPYTHSLNSAERQQATFLQDIEKQAGVGRQRRPGGPTEREVNSTDPSTVLPGSHNSEHEDERNSKARLPAWERIHGLLAKLLPPYSETTATAKAHQERVWGYDNVKIENLEDFVLGIPRLGKLQDLDESFRILRRFGPLGFELLIRKQLEIYNMSLELHRLHLKDKETPSTEHRLYCAVDMEGSDSDKSRLLDRVERTLLSYWDLVLKYAEIQALPSVPARDHRSVQNWLVEHKPVGKGDDQFLDVREDLAFAKIRRRSKNQYGNTVEDLIESMRVKLPDSRLTAFFRDPRTAEKTSSGRIDITAIKIRAAVANVLMALFVVILILLPVFLMFLLNVGRHVMAFIVLGFVFVLILLLTTLFDLATNELFLGIAGYIAILVAILGSKMSEGGNCPSNP